MVYKDQLNRTLEFPNRPKRIVSLVPSQTELLVDLGLEKNIVGVTKFCVHPSNIRKDVSVVGGTKQVHFEKIKTLQPDIIICNKEENTLEMVQDLEKIAPVWLSDIYTIEDALEMILLLGILFDVSKKTKALINEISSEIKDFEAFLKSKPTYKVAYLIWKNPYMIAGRQTFINNLLALNNFENIEDDSESRYPDVSLNDLKGADKILLSSEPFPFKEKHIKEFQKATGKEVVLVDGEYFSWYGSRLKDAFAYFKRLH